MIHRLFNFRTWSINMLWIWLGVFGVLPFCLVVLCSFLTPGQHHLLAWSFTMQNYVQLLDPIYVHIFLRSFGLALFATVLCLCIAYPFAYSMAKLSPRVRPVIMVLLVVPFWPNGLIRIYSIIVFMVQYPQPDIIFMYSFVFWVMYVRGVYRVCNFLS